MTPKNLDLAQLHSLTRESVSDSACGESVARFRERLQEGTCENHLRDLLVKRLDEMGWLTKAEARIPGGRADILLEDAGLFIELKQLHLKDGAKAPYVRNIVNDLMRHATKPCLGVVYVLDERLLPSTSQPISFNGANRRVAHGVDTVLAALSDHFRRVHPQTLRDDVALIRTFHGNGRLDLYAFVVSEPVRSAANASR